MKTFGFAAVALLSVSLPLSAGLAQEQAKPPAQAQAQTKPQARAKPQAQPQAQPQWPPQIEAQPQTPARFRGRPQDALKAKRTVAARTALCQDDCRPNVWKPNDVGMHGFYRSYNEYDPHLTSIQGRKDYAQCVKACVDPLPSFYVQKPIFAMGMNWFGKTADSCYDCHATQATPASTRSRPSKKN